MPKRIVKAPCMRNSELPFIFGTQRFFENPHTSDHSPGTPPGPHNGVEPSGKRKFVLANASSIMLLGRGSLPDWRRHAAPKNSPATKSTCSCKKSRVCKQQVLRESAFLGICVVNVERHHGEGRLAIARYPSTRDDGLQYPS